MKKNLYIKTFGCQMNVYDSERMLEAVSKTHKLVTSPNDADAILLNTCHIREKAAEKVYSEIGKFSDLIEGISLILYVGFNRSKSRRCSK